MATPLRYRIRQSPLGRRLPHSLSRFIRAYHWLLHGHVHPRPGTLLHRIGDTRVVYVNGSKVLDLK